MKSICAFLAVLCLLPLSCKPAEPPAPDTAASDPAATTPATDTSKTDAAELRDGKDAVTVTFVGLIAHVFVDDLARAIIPDVPGHPVRAAFPSTMQADLEKAFGAKAVNCKSGVPCEVKINDVGLRIVTAQAPAAFTSTQQFKDVVTHLGKVPAAHKPFEKKGDLIDEVWTPKAKSHVLAGYFELANGEGDAIPFGCKGRFKGETAWSDFPMEVNVTYPSGSDLQYLPFGETNWKDVGKLPAGASIEIVNNMPGSGGEHFKAFNALSKKQGNGSLPEVEKESKDCLAAYDDVPGCSNSQWP